jgi:hypothetical protein
VYLVEKVRWSAHLFASDAYMAGIPEKIDNFISKAEMINQGFNDKNKLG